MPRRPRRPASPREAPVATGPQPDSPQLVVSPVKSRYIRLAPAIPPAVSRCPDVGPTRALAHPRRLGRSGGEFTVVGDDLFGVVVAVAPVDLLVPGKGSR